MLKKLLLGAAVFVVTACGSDSSPPAYTSNSSIYCNESETPNPSATVIASCLDSNDLPISGGCMGGASDDVSLVTSGPYEWDTYGGGARHGWQCRWAANGRSGVADGTAVVVEDAAAYICCATVP
jgi:hypothetical protein